jgi:aminoglycoside phosphotransferase (APT) family kinase protein
LSFTIPKPLALGKPSKDYPWNWSVFKYIKGEIVNILTINELHFKSIALQLAQFLNELHKVDQTGGPFLGTHNFYRGGSLQVYDSETKLALSKLQGFTNIEAAKSIC